MSNRKNGAAVRLAFRRAATLTLVLGMAAACDTGSILEVDDPEVVTDDKLADPDVLPIVVAGAISDFHVAYSGAGDDSYLSNVANFSDEMRPADTFGTRKATDQREQFPMAQGNTSDAAYRRLHQARRSLKVAAAAVTEVAGAGDARIAELKALEGFTYVALGEAFCSGIPFSEVVDDDYVVGVPLETAAVFDSAVVRFDAALAVDGSYNLAKIGKARALLNNGDYAAAAAAVADVPTDFVYFIDHSANSGRQNNPIFALQSNGRYTVSDLEGGNGLPFRSAGDPRVPWALAEDSVGFDGTTPLFIDLRYPLRDSDVPVAGGVEARLIEAEAALAAGGDWLAILNELRATVATIMAARVDGYEEAVPGASLDPLADPGDPQARVDLLFHERAFWGYGTGHRLGDMRRLIRQYGRAPDTIYPTGAYYKGGTYGNDVALPLDYDEVNNEHFEVPMCNVDQA